MYSRIISIVFFSSICIHSLICGLFAHDDKARSHGSCLGCRTFDPSSADARVDLLGAGLAEVEVFCQTNCAPWDLRTFISLSAIGLSYLRGYTKEYSAWVGISGFVIDIVLHGMLSKIPKNMLSYLSRCSQH